MFSSILLKISCWLFRPPKLKNWAIAEDKKKLIIEAVEDNTSNFPDAVSDYLSTALYFNIDTGSMYWKDVMDAMSRVASKSTPNVKIPLTTTEGPKQKDEPWEYSGRSWYVYANLLAHAYGWELKKIEQMDVKEALSLVQEILVDDQLDKEFIHSLSEVAYHYDKSTKKSEYKRLPRPSWMVFKQMKKSHAPTRIAKSLLPVGNVIDMTRRDRDETQETKPE